MKKVLFIQTIDSFDNQHTVKELSPFLLVDYQTELHLNQNNKNFHANKEMEVITIVYSSEYEKNKDTYPKSESTPGDKEWMQNKAGLIDVEDDPMDNEDALQLWVNLPKKMSSLPENEGVITCKAPIVDLKNHAGKLKVIMGEYDEAHGPFKTPDLINIWDMRLKEGHILKLKVPEGHSAALFVLNGKVTLSSGHIVGPAHLAVLEREGNEFSLHTNERTQLLFLGGDPVNEAVIGIAPFDIKSPHKILSQMQMFDHRKYDQHSH